MKRIDVLLWTALLVNQILLFACIRYIRYIRRTTGVAIADKSALTILMISSLVDLVILMLAIRFDR